MAYGGVRHGFFVGLRWLDAADDELLSVSGRDWGDVLRDGAPVSKPSRLQWATLWPLAALVSGPLALSGLMIWPERSGVHLLLFFMVFVLTPLLLLVWSASRGLAGYSPWWRRLLIKHDDPVIALWCARQSVLSQGVFCMAGLLWMWLMLATREVVFYWSTSILAVSEQVANLFGLLSLGLLPVPRMESIFAAEAGAISGWQTALLSDSVGWASWLTQVVVLWMLVPWLLLLAWCHWRLQRRIRAWPQYNQRLRLRFERALEPAVSYRALQPEQPPVEPAGHRYPLVEGCASHPGFGWRVDRGLPPSSVPLGTSHQSVDGSTIRDCGEVLRHWYIASHAAPTGDLADLLLMHRDMGVSPELNILLTPVDNKEERLDALRHSWGVFLERNGLDLPVRLLLDTGTASEQEVRR